MSSKERHVWAFQSSSNPKVFYQTIQWENGDVTCNCPGWCRRSIRECKHTRAVALGTADMECHNHMDYSGGESIQALRAPQAKAKPQKQKQPVEKSRAFDFS